MSTLDGLKANAFAKSINQGKSAIQIYSKIRDKIDSGLIELPEVEDESRLTIENLPNLSETELYHMIKKNELGLVIPGTAAGIIISYLSLTSYLLYKNHRAITDFLVPKHKKNLWTLSVKGTLIATVNVGILSILLYGFNETGNYMHRIRANQKALGELTDRYNKDDELLQETYLFDSMEYYKLPEEMVNEARRILESRRVHRNKDKNRLMHLLLDDLELEEELVNEAEEA